MRYEDFEFKIPVESEDYLECSDYVIAAIEAIIQGALDSGKNKIVKHLGKYFQVF